MVIIINALIAVFRMLSIFVLYFVFCFNVVDFHQPSNPHHRILLRVYLEHRLVPSAVGFEFGACAVV